LRRSALLGAAELAPASDDAHLRRRFARLLETGGGAGPAAGARAPGRRAGGSARHHPLGAAVAAPRPAARGAPPPRARRPGRRRPLVPALLDALGARPTQQPARDGLAAFGDRVAGTLGDYLSDATVPMQIRLEIPRVLSRIGTADAVQALFRYRSHDDVRLSY